jgi:hypothetical protein
MEKKLIAISTNGSNGVSLVKSVNEQEYKTLINNQEKHLAKGEKLALEHKQQHNSIELGLKHFARLHLILAKSVYDNFVDRGLIENDDAFQQMWFDFYFNDKELEIEKAINDEQARIWNADCKKYNEDEKRIDKIIKDMNKRNLDSIMEQIQKRKEQKKAQAMSRVEYAMNRDALEKAREEIDKNNA